MTQIGTLSLLLMAMLLKISTPKATHDAPNRIHHSGHPPITGAKSKSLFDIEQQYSLTEIDQICSRDVGVSDYYFSEMTTLIASYEKINRQLRFVGEEQQEKEQHPIYQISKLILESVQSSLTEVLACLPNREMNKSNGRKIAPWEILCLCNFQEYIRGRIRIGMQHIAKLMGGSTEQETSKTKTSPQINEKASNEYQNSNKNTGNSSLKNEENKILNILNSSPQLQRITNKHNHKHPKNNPKNNKLNTLGSKNGNDLQTDIQNMKNGKANSHSRKQNGTALTLISIVDIKQKRDQSKDMGGNGKARQQLKGSPTNEGSQEEVGLGQHGKDSNKSPGTGKSTKYSADGKTQPILALIRSLKRSSQKSRKRDQDAPQESKLADLESINQDSVVMTPISASPTSPTGFFRSFRRSSSVGQGSLSPKENDRHSSRSSLRSSLSRSSGKRGSFKGSILSLGGDKFEVKIVNFLEKVKEERQKVEVSLQKWNQISLGMHDPAIIAQVKKQLTQLEKDIRNLMKILKSKNCNQALQSKGFNCIDQVQIEITKAKIQQSQLIRIQFAPRSLNRDPHEFQELFKGNSPQKWKVISPKSHTPMQIVGY